MNNQTITGTNCFPSVVLAQIYYKAQEGSLDAAKAVVRQKIKSKEIFIGEPELKPGELLSVRDCRYHVTSSIVGG